MSRKRYPGALVAAVLAMASVLPASPHAQEPAQVTLVADPETPGPDTPPVGRSAFDELYGQRDRTNGSRLTYNIPFPFEKLLESINGGLGGARAKAVLIPYGRSLQRFASDPDYLAFPRIVVGVDRDPRAGSRNMPVLRDRLFLGYQERSRIIEIISYNEQAGRFEFQIVENYGGAGGARVRYAERTTCLQCHQGHAPIFPTAEWTETSGNPDISKRLARHFKQFHGVRPAQGIDVSDAIDLATDRANLISFVNFVWNRGCGVLGAKSDVACRAWLLEAVLRYRLGGSRAVVLDSKSQLASLATDLHKVFRTRAPGGLGTPSPDLPNRDPLSDIDAGMSANDAISPEGAFDPAEPRAPIVLWRPTDKRTDLVTRWVRYAGGFFSPSDVASLSSWLSGSKATKAAPRRWFRAKCDTREIARDGDRSELRFECAHDGDASAGFEMSGYLLRHSGKIIGGRVRSLSIGGRARVHYLEIAGRRTERLGSKPILEIELRESAMGLAARLASGERLDELRIDFAGAGPATAQIAVVDDVAALHRSIARMQKSAHTSLGPGPLRRRQALESIRTSLSMRLDGSERR